MASYLCTADIDEEFQDNLRELTPMFLAPDNLVVKEINGTPVTGRGLLECFKVSRKRSHEDRMTILHSAWCMLGCAGTPMHEMMFPFLVSYMCRRT